MSLSNDLISQFAKLTAGEKKQSAEATVYGTTVEYEDRIFVKIDGSDLLTPVETTSDIKSGQRVMIKLKDHTATVTGNVTDPSVGQGKVDDAKEEIKGELDGAREVIKVEVLEAVDAKIENLEVEDLKAVNAEIENLKANKAEITDLTATNAQIENLKANKAEITDLTATNANITTLNADLANIKTLVNGNLTSDNILSFLITADKVTMADAFIKDAHIANINANKINSGVINTSNVSVVSEDGGISIADETMQFKDENGVVRIQIGRDKNNNFTFVLYDETGRGQLINADGIQSSAAIKDGLIRDDHISDDAAISGSKLDISSVITEINDDNSTTLKSSKIYLDDKNQTLEVAFNSLSTKVDTIEGITVSGDLSSVIEQIQSNTTEINVAKGNINTLVAENTIIKESVKDLDGELETVNETLSSKYTLLEQNLEGFKTTVSSTYATKSSLNSYSTTTQMNSAINQKADSILSTVSSTYVSTDTLKNYSTTTQMNSAIEQKASGILSTVSATYATQSELDNMEKEIEKDMNNLATTMSSAYVTPTQMNSAIEQKASNILSTVSATYISTDTLNNYSTTAQMNSAIDQKATSILSTVSSTYATKTTASSIEQTANKISWIIKSGTSSSNMVLTDNFYSIASQNISLTADRINLNGYVSSDNDSWSISTDGNFEANNLSVGGTLSCGTVICDEISSKAYQKSLTSGGTIYVNSSTGDDSNEFKSGNKFATLQGAIDSIPKNMNGKTIKIQLENNVTEDIDINYFSSGTLSLYCNGKTIYGYISVKGCSSYVYILGGNTSSSSNNTGVVHPKTGVDIGDRTSSIGAVQSNYVSIQYMKVYGADNQASGLTGNKVCVAGMTAANIYINTVAVTKTDVGFRVSSMASMHMNKSSGVASTNGFQAITGGKISFANNSQTGGKDNATYSSTGGQIWLGSSTTFEAGSATTDTTTAPSTTVTKTVTYTANYADTYRSTVYNNWKKDGTARQGNWGYGNCTGCWFFGDDFEGIAKKTVTKVQITFKRQSGGYNASRTHYFYTHSHEGRPGTSPTLVTAIGSASAAVGDTVTYTITNSSYISAIKSAKGIAIRDTNYSSDKYSVCSGTMKVKFTYTVTT